MPSDTAAPLEEFLADLQAVCEAAQDQFSRASGPDDLEQARVEFLGARQGRLKSVQKRLPKIAKEDKRLAGQRLNEVKHAIQSAFDSAKEQLTRASTCRARDPSFDSTLPGTVRRIGRRHPITQTIDELKDIMGRLGFTVADGPEVEDPWHNFDALNIPETHPARDPLDNFYLSVAGTQSSDMLLRSQTSNVQIRAMEQTGPPIRVISVGRVYRPDTGDSTHYPMFHQIEGLWVDRDISMVDLKTVLHLFAVNYLGGETPVRVRPSFFPFTEPSVEADYYWNGKWVEFGGAGIVDPHVLEAVGYNPEEVSGFAFGLGVERLTMIRHQITDIRSLFTNDVRFLRQF